jgi:RNA recognition motif-containing protein
MRFGAGRGAGESMGRPGGSRDDLPTLRVTNISEDTQENDLRELFGGFGRVARVYVGRDRETGAGKGFAFVSFEERANAQKAIEKVHGKGYDNLILSVQWSRKCRLFVLEHWTNTFWFPRAKTGEPMTWIQYLALFWMYCLLCFAEYTFSPSCSGG